MTIAVLMVGGLFCFVIRFPDGPIHICSSHGYCGKQGQPHSLRDFESYVWWESVLFASWLPGILGIGLLQQRVPNSSYRGIPENVMRQVLGRPAPDYAKIRETYRSDK